MRLCSEHREGLEKFLQATPWPPGLETTASVTWFCNAESNDGPCLSSSARPGLGISSDALAESNELPDPSAPQHPCLYNGSHNYSLTSQAIVMIG